MARKTFLSIGECMIEFAREPDGRWRQGFAGDTFNCAWHFARAADPQAWQTAYFTTVGMDPFSRHMIDFMEANAISARWVRRDETAQPGLYLIETNDGERSFTYWRNDSAAKRLADDPTHLRKAVHSSELLFFSGITLAILKPKHRQTLLQELAKARSSKILIAFDPNIRTRLWENAKTMRETIMQAAAIANYVLPSFEDEREAFGDRDPEACAKRYLDNGAGEVVVKNGGSNVVSATRSGEVVTIPLRKVDPVDTTGAGDAFNGAYLAACMEKHPPGEAILRAHEVAVRTIGHPGALV